MMRSVGFSALALLVAGCTFRSGRRDPGDPKHRRPAAWHEDVHVRPTIAFYTNAYPTSPHTSFRLDQISAGDQESAGEEETGRSENTDEQDDFIETVPAPSEITKKPAEGKEVIRLRPPITFDIIVFPFSPYTLVRLDQEIERPGSMDKQDDTIEPVPLTSEIATKPAEWKAYVQVRSRITHDSNLFRLSPPTSRRFEQKHARDQANGRFRNMDELDDFIESTAVRAGVEGPGPVGNSVSIWTKLEYNLYLRNNERSHAEVELNGRQDVGDNGWIYLSVEVTPDYFKRNYLVDGLDRDLSGAISTSERVYAEGVVDQWSYRTSYRRRFSEVSDSRFLGVTGELELSYERRFYNFPFQGRDQGDISLLPEIEFEFGRRFGLTIRSEVGRVINDEHDEVVLLDEPDYLRDFNSDLDAFDNNVGRVQRIDRSYDHYEVETAFRYSPIEDLDLELAYARRWKKFLSKFDLDPAHRDRSDVRDVFAFSAEYSFSKIWEASAGWSYGIQTTDRIGDPDGVGKGTDYRASIGYLSVTYRW